MLSQKAKYGLKVLLALARDYGCGPVLIADLARRESVPQKFLELILLELKHQGVVQSKKGQGGGYFLLQRPEQIAFGRIIRILDGPLAPVPCVSETAYMPCAECPDEVRCGVRLVMKEVRDAAATILDHTTLADALRRLPAGRLGKKRRPLAALRTVRHHG